MSDHTAHWMILLGALLIVSFACFFLVERPLKRRAVRGSGWIGSAVWIAGAIAVIFFIGPPG